MAGCHRKFRQDADQSHRPRTSGAQRRMTLTKCVEIFGRKGLTDVAGAYNGNDLFTNNEVSPVTGLIAGAPFATATRLLVPLGSLLGRAWRYVRGADRISDEISAAGTAIARAPRGTLLGKLDNLTVAERKCVDDLLAQGKNVEMIPVGAGRTPDFLIDGVRYELKTLSGVVDETADGISDAIANRVMNGRGQATDIIIEAKNQAGITEEIARCGIRRAFGADNKSGGQITSITIHGPGWTIIVPRI